MKKMLFFMLLLTFGMSMISAYELDIIQGQENIETVMKAKPVWVVLNAENTMYFKESYDSWITEFNAQQKSKGKKEIDKIKMLKDMRDKFSKDVKVKGGKWKLKLIADKSAAKDGYVLIVNVDQVSPMPMLNYTAKFSITAYKAGSDEILFKVKISNWLTRPVNPNAVGPNIIGLPKDALKEAGELLADLLPSFLRKGK